MISDPPSCFPVRSADVPHMQSPFVVLVQMKGANNSGGGCKHSPVPMIITLILLPSEIRLGFHVHRR